MSPDWSISRRDALRRSAAIGAATTGLPGLAAAVEDVDASDVESLLQSDEVRAIEGAVPGLEFDATGAKALSDDDDTQYAVVVPANHGRLVVASHDGSRRAALHFDEWVAGVDADWPRGTDARLVATDGDVTFQRTATATETERILEGVGRTDLVGADGVFVSLAPSADEYYVTHVDPDAGRAEMLTARDSGGAGLAVVERETWSADGDVSAQACDCNDEAADLIYCVYQAGSCLSCFIGSPVPPVLAACIVFVCVGGTGGILLTFVANLGCTDLDPGCVQDCAESVWDGLV